MPAARRALAHLCALLLLVEPLLVTGCSSVPADKRILQYLNTQGFGSRYSGNAEEENYVTLGDAITWRDSYNPEVVGAAVVDIDGTITLLNTPAGAVHVAGMTRAELESYLTQKLSPYFAQTDVRVTIQTGPRKVYYVLGEVRAPGPKPFLGDVTVLQAVLLAFPEEHTAALSRVRVITPDPRDPRIIECDVSDLWEVGDSTYNIHVHENDIVYVPPTILKSFADLVSGVLVPITAPFRALIQFLFPFRQRGRFGNQNPFF
jgi:protein involved in polysaccharide export with SLBB domain